MTSTYFNKNFTIKILDRFQNFLDFLPNVADIRLSKVINAGQGEMNLTIPVVLEDIDWTVIDFNNILKVDVYYDAFSGTVFQGRIDKIGIDIENGKEILKLHTTGPVELMAKTIYRHDTDVTIDFSATEIATIIADIIDSFKNAHDIYWSQPVSMINDTDIDTTGVNLTRTYNVKTILEALEETKKFVGDNYFWYIDSDLTFKFKQVPDSPTHTFIFGKDVVAMHIEKNIQNLVTNVFFWNGDTISKLYYRGELELAYLRRQERIKDERITDTTTAHNLGKFEIDTKGTPDHALKFRVKNTYITENIKPGETCQILNAPISTVFSNNMLITRVDYTLDYVDVTVENKNAQTARELQELTNHYLNIEYAEDQPDVAIEIV